MIVDKLNDIINSYSENSSLKNFCFYVKENIEEIEYMNINQLAKGCYVSKGQISKYTRQLGYNSFAEFKNDCISYKDSLTRKTPFFNRKISLIQNVNNTMIGYVQCLKHTMKRLDYVKLEQLTQDILSSHYVYLYGQGDVRGNCYNIQRELKYLGKSVMILDEKLSKNYKFQENDILIVLSTNGQLFEYNKRRIKKIKEIDVNKWLITCHDSLNFCRQQLYIPSENIRYNELIMTYVLNIMIMNLQINV